MPPPRKRCSVTLFFLDTLLYSPSLPPFCFFPAFTILWLKQSFSLFLPPVKAPGREGLSPPPALVDPSGPPFFVRIFKPLPLRRGRILPLARPMNLFMGILDQEQAAQNRLCKSTAAYSRINPLSHSRRDFFRPERLEPFCPVLVIFPSVWSQTNCLALAGPLTTVYFLLPLSLSQQVFRAPINPRIVH